MSAPSQKLLTVLIGFNHLSGRWEPEYIKFANNLHYDFGRSGLQLHPNAKRGVTAVCLLAVLVKRARSLGLPDVIIPDGLREHLKPYWSSRSGAEWPKKLFGENPRGKFIHDHVENGQFVLDFDQSVELEISFIDLKTGQKAPGLNTVLKQFSRSSFEEEDSFFINVHKAGWTISSLNRKGGLRRHDQVWVEITAPIEESICAFWIDSHDNGLFTLHPTLDPRVNIPIEESCQLGGDEFLRTYRIPGKRTFGISGEGGIETCVVLRREREYSEVEEREIQQAISGILKGRNASAYLEHPKHTHGTIEELIADEPQTSDTRLEPAWQLKPWEFELAQKLQPHCDRLHLFHIPNRGSRTT